MGKRLQGILIGIIVSAFVAGGVAYAVTVVPSDSADRYYACVSTSGVVKSATLKLNVQPASCPMATDTVRSWNAQGPAGGVGATGPQGAAAPAPKNILIHLANGDVNITTSVGPSWGTTYASGIDLSGCRRVTGVMALTDGYDFPNSGGAFSASLREELPGGPTSPAWWQAPADGSGTLTLAQFRPVLLTGGGNSYSTNPSGSDLYPLTTASLVFSKGSLGNVLVHDAWISCEPYS